MRSVVSISGTLMDGLCKWLNHWMQHLRVTIPTYLWNSSHLIELLQEQGQLPPGAIFCFAEAVFMYTNIDTNHGVKMIIAWMDEYQD